MASKAAGANFVRFFFYARHTFSPEEQQRLVALAYSTARDLEVAPKSILIRSGLHCTTSVQGKHVLDENGWHVTLSFKNDDQQNRQVHFTSHGYTSGKHNHTLVYSNSRNEKRDDTPRGDPALGNVVWPREDELIEYVNGQIAYSHLPEGSKK